MNDNHDFAARAANILARACADPAETVTVAVHSADGSMVITTRCGRPLDLVLIARSLLGDAETRLAEAIDDAEENGGDAAEAGEELLDQVEAALAELPDPHADDANG
jgi:hypothetical protein